MKVKELVESLLTLDQEELIFLPVDEEYMSVYVVSGVQHSNEKYAYNCGIIPYSRDLESLAEDCGCPEMWGHVGCKGYMLQ